MADRYQMLYCDTARCAVNTFEHFDEGECPGCGERGVPLEPGGSQP